MDIYNYTNDSPDIGEGEYFLIEGNKLEKDEVNHLISLIG